MRSEINETETKMSFTKQYFKTKPYCKVTFTLHPEAARNAQAVQIVGDFNNWDFDAAPMKRKKDGSFSLSLNLEREREYQFRYLLDQLEWENDWNADGYVPSPFGGADNSVVKI